MDSIKADTFSASTASFSNTALDFISLTKPRIIPLLLVATCCPMVLASKGYLSFGLVIATLMGGGLVSASASVFNCIWDRDIDALMKRTSNRPLPNGRLNLFSAYLFATVLGLFGLWIFAKYTNETACLVALGGHLFYVFVYTLWLKRLTPQNIVIGGAAGAVPPLVGWAAVTGEVNLTAILLFMVIFFWTPPHFWALALNKNADYQKAGVPMLPVIAGPSKTYFQMLMYSLILLITSMVLVVSSPELGLFSVCVFSFLGLIFIWKIVLLKSTDNPQSSGTKVNLKLKGPDKRAWEVFGFSLIYLTLFFITIVVDSTII